MQSTLKNMVLVLFLITLFASGAVAVVYHYTEEPIAAAQAAKTAGAIGEVVPAFDNDIAATKKEVAIDGGTAILYTAEKGGKPIGYAIETFTNKGYSGLITLMVGFLPDGTIQGIRVLQHAETPGLGSNMTEPGNVLTVSFEGKNPAELNMSVKKDGGDIDALTASTITSRAYTDAVDRAWRVFQAETKGVEPVQEPVIDPCAIIFPGYDNDPAAEKLTVKADTTDREVFPVKKGGELLGCLIPVSAQGFNSGVPIELAVGFAPDGTILNIVVTRQAETEGYGAEILKEDNPLLLSFKGKQPGGEVQAISGATVTSEAYVKAVEAAIRAFQLIKQEDVQ
jgi:electron transport complex protein RnfG